LAPITPLNSVASAPTSLGLSTSGNLIAMPQTSSLLHSVAAANANVAPQRTA
jgi:hypothetical protein